MLKRIEDCTNCKWGLVRVNGKYTLCPKCNGTGKITKKAHGN